jgi:pentatricopeptide repeat protein
MGSSKLVDMHAKCGSIEDVLEMFSKMSIHSVVAWTAMLQDMSCVGLVGKLLDI